MSKGFELSVNFLVVLILSIIMLGLGIQLIRSFFTTAQDVGSTINEQTNQKLSDMLSQGQIVAIGFNRLDIPPNTNNIFGLGILNALTHKADFTITITPPDTVGYTASNEPIPKSTWDTTNWTRYTHSITLERDASDHIPIFVRVPPGVPKATYVFNVVVQADGADYGSVKFYVNT